MPVGFPLTDAARQSFPSIEAKFGTQVFLIHAINYSRTRSRTLVRLNHPDPVGKTRGSNEYKADCEMLLSEFEQLRKAMGGAGYGDKFFDVIVTYSENGLDTVTDVLKGCTIDSTDASNAQGDDATMRKFELNPVKVLFGGDDDVSNPLQAPPGG